VDCTEGFSRQRVKEVLDLEAVYQTHQQPPSNSVERSAEFRAYSGVHELEQLQSMLVLTSDSIRNEGDDEGDDEGVSVDDSHGEGGEMSSTGGSAEDVNIDDIKGKVSTHMLARCVQLWNPWWYRDLSGPASLSMATTAVRVFEVREGMSQAIHRIRRTAPRLDTLVNTSKLSSDLLGYQIFGLVLGYVVTMRTLNGDWCDAPIEAMIQLVLSTPAATDKTFQPLSVVQAVEAWLRYRPASLQQTSRRTVRALLEDTLAVLRVWEFVSFALLECWVMAHLACHAQQYCDTVDVGGSPAAHGAEAVENKYMRLLECMRAHALSDAVDEVLPAMDEYSEVFRKPKKAKAKNGCDEGGRGRMSDDLLGRESAELLARKSFLLLLFTLDDGSFGTLRSLSTEVHEYLTTFMA
jgi:hypothetical protein